MLVSALDHRTAENSCNTMKIRIHLLALGSLLLVAGCEQKIVTPPGQPTTEKKTETNNTTVVNPPGGAKSTTTETTTTEHK